MAGRKRSDITKKERSAEYYKTHRDDIRQRKADYYKANREALIAKSKAYYLANREQIQIQSHNRYQRHKFEKLRGTADEA